MAKATKQKPQDAQIPLIMRSHRLMEAFAKSSDERDFYVDRIEGFIIYVDLDKSEEELAALENELKANPERYYMVPKLTFYETKKIMEGFVNEKVYDIDVKEKLLDIIQSKEARENFLEYIYDHHAEYEKWQQFYQERSRIRIIEWLRQHHFHFVFEEDLDLPASTIEKLKKSLFEKKVGKDIEVARKTLLSKAKSYYSNEALNPRPKRGRPPKQAQKLELEPQITTDIFTAVPPVVRPFLFTPEITSAFEVTFSARFETGKELIAHRRQAPPLAEFEEGMNNITEKLAMLRELSSSWSDKEKEEKALLADAGEEEEEEEQPEEEEQKLFNKLTKRKGAAKRESAGARNEKKPIATKGVKKLIIKQESRKKEEKKPVKKKQAPKKAAPKRIIPQAKKAAPAKKTSKKAATKKTTTPKAATKIKTRPAKKVTTKSAKKTAPKKSVRKPPAKKPASPKAAKGKKKK